MVAAYMQALGSTWHALIISVGAFVHCRKTGFPRCPRSMGLADRIDSGFPCDHHFSERCMLYHRSYGEAEKRRGISWGKVLTTRYLIQSVPGKGHLEVTKAIIEVFQCITVLGRQ